MTRQPMLWRTSWFAGLFAAVLLVVPGHVRAEEAADGPTLVRTYCSGCHVEAAPGRFDRISNLRKSAEGWVMTLFRMRQVHGLALPEDARDGIVRHLADTQGLAPSESAAGRFALERRPNVPDLKLEGDDTNTMCARCHSAARVSLQRRDADEWLKLVHTHVGQWPTLEYQASSRDRLWWQVATTEIPGRLGKLFPHDTDAWKAWQAHAPIDASGEWLVTGHVPGRGAYTGTATIVRAGDGYAATWRLAYADGTRLDGDSKAVVYTGYEWRGTATLGGQHVREVYALGESGDTLRGRWFLAEHSESGGDFSAVRAGGAARIVAVTPSALRIGATQTVIVQGVGLDGAPDFGPGTKARVLSRDAAQVAVEVAVDAKAAAGQRGIAIGAVQSATPVALYAQVERIAIEPSYAIARVGGGRLAPVPAQFEAIGYASVPGADGKPVDVRLGASPARWETAPFDAQATRDRDHEFAGRIDATGRFVPAGGGPNPARQFAGNNVGNLSVVAKVADGARELSGSSRLIVTVQRWNTPPIY